MSEVSECQGKCACGDTCRRVDGHLEHECPKCNYLREMRDDEPLRSGGITATPALDRASIPAMFNVVGDELRKLTNHIIRIEAQLTALRADADKGRERMTDSLDLVGAAEFTQIKCLLDLTNKRLKALELVDRRARKKKQERKRGGRR